MKPGRVPLYHIREYWDELCVDVMEPLHAPDSLVQLLRAAFYAGAIAGRQIADLFPDEVDVQLAEFRRGTMTVK
jgi:hypothetical protein